MSLIKQNLSLKAVNYLELALEEFLNKYKPIMDDKHIYELNGLLFQTRQIKLAASIYQESVEKNQLRGSFLYPYYEDTNLDPLKWFYEGSTKTKRQKKLTLPDQEHH